MQVKTVTISVEEYIDLKTDAHAYSMLCGGGVDNWQGYSDSLYPDDEESIEDYTEKLSKGLGYDK